MKIETGFFSHAAGRSQNEDSVGISRSDGSGEYLLVVADGMGGHESGEVASRIVVQTILREFEERSSENSFELGRAVSNVYYALQQEALSGKGNPSMGSTVVCLYLQGNVATIAHVGDSRIMRFDRRRVQRLTADHLSLVDSGRYTDVQAKEMSDGNVLSRALTTKRLIEPDVSRIHLSPGEVVLLCTDGVSEYVDERRMFQLIRRACPQEDAKRIVNEAIARKTDDNATVAILYFW